MTIQKIEDVKNPQVGRFYLVPCVEFYPSVISKKQMLPVIGPWHEDADIGFEPHHFHYDVRFCSDKIFTPLYIIRGHLYRASVPEVFNEDSKIPPTVTYCRRKMRRQMPDFPKARPNAKRPEWQIELEQKYSTHVLKCHTCPHRGMSLDGLPIDAQGRVVCNGHGLRWNLNTGRLSPRGEA